MVKTMEKLPVDPSALEIKTLVTDIQAELKTLETNVEPVLVADNAMAIPTTGPDAKTLGQILAEKRRA